MTWMLQAIYRRLKYDNLLGNSKNQVQKSFSRPPVNPLAPAPPSERVMKRANRKTRANEKARSAITSRLVKAELGLGQRNLVAVLERDDGFLPSHGRAGLGGALAAGFAPNI
jgi:hypothetical protein